MKTAYLKQLFAFLLCFFLHLISYAQKEANNWYFGLGAGISFNSNPPLALSNGQTDGLHGFASMSDKNGNLLFYTNGESWVWPFQKKGIYDRQHQKMPNSGNLASSAGQDHVPLIVPWPGQPQKYYYFHIGNSSSNSFQAYSVVDMSLNGGFGDLSNIQNVRINDRQAKYTVAVQHRNSRDFWVIYLNDSSNVFKSFQISPTGISTSPIVSTPSFPSGGTAWNAVLKMSPDGKTMAMVRGKSVIGLAATSIELFNFDAASGAVTYKGVLPDSTSQKVEFSPDGTKLYAARYIRVSGTGPATYHFELVQYDLEAGTPAAIYNSATIIYTAPSYPVTSVHANDGTTSMQVGPDGKIYMITTIVPQVWPHALSVINRPNLKGKACRFIPDMFNLDPTNSNPYQIMTGYQLPTFVQSYFYRPKITMKQTCFGDTAFFALGNPAYVDSVEWNFGDPGSGSQNTSTLFNPKHFYATPGPKQVQAIVHFNFDSDTLQQTIYIPATITKPNLGKDMVLCFGDTILLNAYQPGATYEWQDSINTDPVYRVTKPGTYSVQVSNGCGTLGDTITIYPPTKLTLNLPANTVLCPGQTLTLQVNTLGTNLLWSDSTTANTLTISRPGTYWAELSNNCGSSVRDSITVTYHPVPNTKWLPDDGIFCKQSYYTINGTYPYALRYKWQDGSTKPSFTATASGIYWLEVTTACTTIRDSMTVTLIPTPPLNLGPDTVLCLGEQLTLKVNTRGVAIRWHDNSTDTVFTVTKPGTYWAEITNNCGSWRDSITVKQERCFAYAFLPNIITPNNDNQNDTFEPKGLEVGQWQLEIYNRWGILVYKNENYKDQWPDNNFNSGTYYYLLRQKATGKTHKGWVEVVR